MPSPPPGSRGSTGRGPGDAVKPPEHHRDYLLGIARFWIDPTAPDRLEPSDMVQQTLLAAYENLEQFRGGTDAEMAGWLRAILGNYLAARRRSAAHPVGRARPLEAAPGRSSARPADVLAGSGTSPSAAAVRAEGAFRLASALALLPDDQREAVELRHLGGLPVSEVAARMGRSVAAVAGLLHRGTKRLRELLGEHP